MSREAQVPLFLWLTAAILAHLASGQGVSEIARTLGDRAKLRGFVENVRSELRPEDQTFEIVSLESPPGPTAAAPAEAPPDVADEAPSEAPEDPLAEKAPDPKRPEEKKPEPVAKAEKKPEEKKPEEKAPEKPAEAPKPPPQADRRLAVKQHVEKDQKDNPNASRIADDAHHTDEETVARVRSYDQDHKDPTPGTNVRGPKGEIGNAEESKIAHAEEKKGDPTRAPGESAEKSPESTHENPAPPAPPKPAGAPKIAAVAPRPAGRPEAPRPSAGGAGPAAPEVAQGDKGTWSADPANPGGDGRTKIPGPRRSGKPNDAKRFTDMGRHGVPGMPRLSDEGYEQAIADAKRRKARASAGKALRSAHRGSWEGDKFQRYRAAIENYEPSVKLGNQTSLNAARVPFATYINGIHNRLHPIFAEEFLASLDRLPKGHQFNKQNHITHLEIVLSKNEGKIVRLGVTRSSGMTAYDVVALTSVERASPFGKAPEAIVSPDGNVYLHWEFHRDPYDACTTRNARPYLLKSAPKLGADRPAAPKRPGGGAPSDER